MTTEQPAAWLIGPDDDYGWVTMIASEAAEAGHAGHHVEPLYHEHSDALVRLHSLEVALDMWVDSPRGAMADGELLHRLIGIDAERYRGEA